METLRIKTSTARVAANAKKRAKEDNEKAHTTKIFAAETAVIASSSSPSAVSVEDDSISDASIKMEILDSEEEETTQGDEEYILGNIDPDNAVEEQQQTTEAVMPSSQTDSIKDECESFFIIDDNFEDGDVPNSVDDDTQSTYEVIDKSNDRLYKILKFRNLVLADDKEIDKQETDTDEDGYSDIDLDDDDNYQVIEGIEIVDPYNPVWSNPKNLTRRALPLFEVSKKTGPLHSHTYFFHAILGEYFFHTVADCCNQRAWETQSTTINSNFELCTAHEMSIFFGICLQMGSMKFTTLAEYWTTEATSYHGFVGFSSEMSYERFQTILEVLNFQSFCTEDNGGGTSPNTESKKDEVFIDLQPLLDFFNKRMQAVHECGQNLVLNDPLIYWKGKLNLLNEMNEKFRPNAIMLHNLTEKSGLVLKLMADCTEAEQRKECGSNSKELAFQRLYSATELLKEKFGKGHIAFTSKYYSSYALCAVLIKLGTYSTGILDSKRFGNSRELVLKNLKTMEFATKYAGNIMMVKMRRNGKNSYLLSSDCLAILSTELKRSGQLRLMTSINFHLKTTEMRSCILDYQLALERSEIAWDKRLMIFVMNIIVFNAFLLYKRQSTFVRAAAAHPDNVTFEQYRQKIIELLILNPNDWEFIKYEDVRYHVKKKQQTEVCTEETQIQSTREATPPKLELKKKINPHKKINHRPKAIKCSKGNVVKKKRCSVCYRAGLLNFSQLYCDLCPGMPGLCATPCFKIFHNKKAL